MALEHRHVQPNFFDQFPQYGQLHGQIIAEIKSAKPTSSPTLEAVTQLGNKVLSFARNAGTVEPFRSNWEEHVDHTRLVVAHYTKQPSPFPDWNALVDEYDKDWKRSGLTEPTVLPVAQQILSHVGLWTDSSVRALVLNNLVDRGEMVFSGMAEIQDHFVAEIPQGSMSSVEEAQDFVSHIADHSSEMYTKRPIGHIKHFTPENRMNDSEWKAFMETEVGRKLGLFSTVEWWVVPSTKAPLEPRVAHFRQIRTDALRSYLEDPEYQQFVANSDKAIRQALKDFKAK